MVKLCEENSDCTVRQGQCSWNVKGKTFFRKLKGFNSENKAQYLSETNVKLIFITKCTKCIFKA